jgi:hypothetical protein
MRSLWKYQLGSLWKSWEPLLFWLLRDVTGANPLRHVWQRLPWRRLRKMELMFASVYGRVLILTRARPTVGHNSYYNTRNQDKPDEADKYKGREGHDSWDG